MALIPTGPRTFQGSLQPGPMMIASSSGTVQGDTSTSSKYSFLENRPSVPTYRLLRIFGDVLTLISSFCFGNMELRI